MRCLRVLFGTFLAAQWLRLHILVHGAQFDPLSENEEFRSHMQGTQGVAKRERERERERERVLVGWIPSSFSNYFVIIVFAYSSRDLAPFLIGMFL